MKPKFIPLLAVGAAAVLSLTACGGSSGGGGGSTSYKFSFVQGVAGDEFYVTMQCGIQAEAKKQGITVNTQGPAKFDPTLQKPIVDSVRNGASKQAFGTHAMYMPPFTCSVSPVM